MSDSRMPDLFDRFRRAMDEVKPEDAAAVVGVLAEACRSGRTVFAMGNGGSAATASHFACDLNLATQKSKRFMAVSLNDNIPLCTALSNDFGYPEVFRRQLESRLSPGDVVMVFSASGDSENILRAVALARERGAITVGILGFGGGKAQSQVDHNITVSDRDFDIVESVHATLAHLIAGSFRHSIEE